MQVQKQHWQGLVAPVAAVPKSLLAVWIQMKAMVQIPSQLPMPAGTARREPGWLGAGEAGLPAQPGAHHLSNRAAPGGI